MNWKFWFFGKAFKENTTCHKPEKQPSSAFHAPNETSLAEDCIARGVTKAYEKICNQEEAKRTKTEKEKWEAWNRLIGYKPVPTDICFLGKLGCDIRNTFVVLRKSAFLRRADVHSNIVIRNDAQQRLLSQLRTRKWMWYGGALFAACVTVKAWEVWWFLGALFTVSAIICFLRARALRIAMFESEKITDLNEITSLYSLYATNAGNVLAIASVVLGIATLCYPDKTKLIIDSILQIFG